MLPLISGLLAASVASGRIITRIGRYRAFPIAGTAVTGLSMFLLSRLQVDTPPWLASAFMLVLGVGLGLTMQVIVLVVQNDAPRRDVGVATSSATFLRSMGGSLGVALFGAIFASRLDAKLTALPAAVSSKLSRGINVNPAQVHALPAPLRHDFLLAFADALSPVFLVGTGLAALAFLLALLLREIPLKDIARRRRARYRPGGGRRDASRASPRLALRRVRGPQPAAARATVRG